ncbi:GDP-L-fucose synthase [Insolitispirillum peregrinum]|uniref:GDP-L-fucose synthase n=1 Tax=Insolitispirillum peregrinum TaxID=80876 RepID=A0A1N7JBB1_9PROT|nr:GDP-L-fucose synthase [Insolitispirillum peregrinum]SIS46609.1 GDP-L-fucose synthase [Insolitispirillum peregrinum]
MSTVFDLSGKRVFVAGHRGMVGSAIVRRLASEGCTVLTASRSELDLTNQQAVHDWMAAQAPEVVIVAAAKVGGINANNTLPVDFLYDNLMIEANLIHAAHRCSVQKLLFLGSSCIYPRLAPQPIPEEALLTGPLEPTNEWYAVAKIAGIKLCQAYRRQYGRDFISAMPTNLYGPGDNFHPLHSHVPAALMRRFHEARHTGAEQVEVWGTGTPLREFLHVDDMADACVFLLKSYSDEQHVNVGSGAELTIAAFAQAVKEAVGYQGKLVFDHSKPDGSPRKLMSSARLHGLGWRHKIALPDGLAQAYRWFLDNAAEARL